jgi:hypothetical protein
MKLKSLFAVTIALLFLSSCAFRQSTEQLPEIIWSDNSVNTITINNVVYVSIHDGITRNMVTSEPFAKFSDENMSIYACWVKDDGMSDFIICKTRGFMNNFDSLYVKSDIVEIPGELVYDGQTQPYYSDLNWNNTTYHQYWHFSHYEELVSSYLGKTEISIDETSTNVELYSLDDYPADQWLIAKLPDGTYLSYRAAKVDKIPVAPLLHEIY